MRPVFSTRYGTAYVGDALELLRSLEPGQVDLVLTSPPYLLTRQKSYGNPDETSYIEWLLPFCAEIHRVLAPTGSFVLNITGGWRRKRPARSLVHYEIIMRLVKEIGFELAQEIIWAKPNPIPSPIEWSNRRKLRLKEGFEYCFWLTKDAWQAKVDLSSVRVPYRTSPPPETGFWRHEPSGYVSRPRHLWYSEAGTIPSNVLTYATAGNDVYVRRVRAASLPVHPARMPDEIPRFFIKLLTQEQDLVLDPFAGSFTTCAVAEELRRRWIGIDLDEQYVLGGRLRFDSNADTMYHVSSR